MRHRVKGKKLSRTAEHRRALLGNLATSLFTHDKIDTTQAKAKELLFLHRKTYPRFWEWSDSVQDYGTFHGKLWTVLRWNLYVIGSDINPRSLRNFPAQANAAEILLCSLRACG